MALQQWPGGVLATSYLNNPIVYLNTLLAGFAQSNSFACSADLTLTNATQDVAGCSTTVAVVGANALAIVIGTFDGNVSVSSAGILMQGKCALDGTAQSAVALLKDNGANTRATVAQTWTLPLVTGSHIIKLQASKSGGAGGTHVFQSVHTNMTVLVVDLP